MKFKHLCLMALAAAVVSCGSDPSANDSSETKQGSTTDALTIVDISDAKAAIPPGDLLAWGGKMEYFPNTTLSGSPIVTQTIGKINFSWGAGSPAPYVPADNFSARYTKEIGTTGGIYDIYAASDDGVRLYLDGQLIINDWTAHSLRLYHKQLYIAPGRHHLRIEYFEATGHAALHFALIFNPGSNPPPVIVPPPPPPVIVPPPPPVLPPPPPPPVSSGSWQAEYYSNPYLQGYPYAYESVAKLDFNWDLSGPAALNWQNDDFSVRWHKQQYFAAGQYTLKTLSDDGIRVYVDGALQIDNWTLHSVQENTQVIYLSEGWHSFMVEYFEMDGAAIAKFEITQNNCQQKVNIVACAVPWTPANQAFVRLCKWSNGSCTSSFQIKTSFASDGGFVKFDGLEYDSCSATPTQYYVEQSFRGYTTAAEVVHISQPGDITVSFCR